jgi:hypothetical protein
VVTLPPLYSISICYNYLIDLGYLKVIINTALSLSLCFFFLYLIGVGLHNRKHIQLSLSFLFFFFWFFSYGFYMSKCKNLGENRIHWRGGENLPEIKLVMVNIQLTASEFFFFFFFFFFSCNVVYLITPSGARGVTKILLQLHHKSSLTVELH